MKKSRKIQMVTAVLTAGVLLAGCGASSSTAGSVASSTGSSVPASSMETSSEAAAGNIVEPIAQGTLEDMKTDSYRFAADISSVTDGQMTGTVYAYDAYEKSDVEALKVGDIIRTHDQMTGELTDITINSIETDSEGGSVTINGSIEEGGLELTVDRDVYRTLTFDGYPVYYEVGELTLPLAEDVSVSDTSADPQADAVITEGAEAVEAMFQANSENWTCLNTTVFTDEGKVSGINRIWVP